MYRFNRTHRILLAALVGAVLASASMSAAALVIRARVLLDSGLAIAANSFEPLRASARPAAAVASVRESEPVTGAVDTGGVGITDASSAAGLDVVTAMAAGAEATECGGEGQRACCVAIGEGDACDANLTEIPGCGGDCTCGGANPFGLIKASGTCVKTTHCGDEGERTCIAGERSDSHECADGLTPIPGCSGDCFADNSGTGWGRSLHTCAKVNSGGGFDPIAEPETNVDLSAATPSCSMSGYADLHLHLFADLAHGGGVLAGLAYDPLFDPFEPEPKSDRGINKALQQDFTTDRALVKGRYNEQVAIPLGCPDTLTDSECQKTFFHGAHDILAGDTVGAGTYDGANSNFGAPIFNGWPKWTSTTHQQAYYRWLKRAWQGGLRLTTMLAVTNEALCKTGRRRFHIRYDDTPSEDEFSWSYIPCEDSMAAIKEQITATKAFERWILENDGGWFEIAYTPRDARKIMAEGHLAVVLGVETAELFNCKFPIDQCTLQKNILNESDEGFINTCPLTFDRETNSREGLTACTPAKIEADVLKLHELGVRHVFPIHNFDNAFGGAATWMDTIEVGNRVVEDHWWWPRDCYDEGYRLALGTGVFDAWYKSLLVHVGDGNLTGGVIHSERASCNFFGLFPQGRVLIEELMKKGMIIDVDHMSVKAFNETLEMATKGKDLLDENGQLVMPNRKTQYYPVVASHVQSRDMHEGAILHERMRTREQLLEIKKVGGMIAAMLKDDQQDTDNKGKDFMVQYASPAGSVQNNCRHSSKSFANAYQYAVDTMGGPVAFGSDFNGVAGHLGPRFGTDACGGWDGAQVGDREKERSDQYREGNWLGYPFILYDPFILGDSNSDHIFGVFSQQKTGHKVFDYNRDGLAHIGLLPDFVADLQRAGLPTTQYNEIFKSAEEYIKVWERSEDQTFTEDTCEFYSDPDIKFESVPDWTREGDSTPITFSFRKEWSLNVSCLPLAQTPGSFTFEAEDLPGRTKFTIDCVWNGGDWPGVNPGDPQHGLLSVSATNFLGTSPTKSVTVDVRNREPEIIFRAPSATAVVGEAYTGTITLTDSPAEVLDLTVDWGDGTPPVVAHPVAPGSTPFPFEMSHVYGKLPSSGATYRVVATVSDRQAQPATVSFDLTITGPADTIPPVFESVPAPVTLVQTSAGGATYTPAAATASDNVDPPPTVSMSGVPPGNLFPIGMTTITYTALDAAGNTAAATTTVTVRYQTEPGSVDPVRASDTITVSFGEINSGGFTTATETTLAEAGALPDAFVLGLLVYDVTTTADVEAPIVTCFTVPDTVDGPFMALRVLHREDDVLVDRTIRPPDQPAPNPDTRTICARTSSLSPFVVALLDVTPPTLTVSDVTVTGRDPAVNGATVTFTPSASDDHHLVGVVCTPVSGTLFPFGRTPVSCTAADAADNKTQASFTVTVLDGVPPVIHALSLPNVGLIWPPNGRMVPMTVTASVTDNLSTPSCSITGVQSNEPSAAGDWRITGPLSVELRASRAGGGSGRVYTIGVRCVDAAGNAATSQVTATVPHDQGKK